MIDGNDRGAYVVFPGPWGPIHVAVLGGAIVALELMTPTESFVASLERRLHRPLLAGASAAPEARGLLEGARSQVEDYLAGRRQVFDLRVSLAGLTDWDRLVLAGVRQVPFGTVTSYGRLARMIGRPGAARAAGGAVGRNPIGVIIPCHRVVAGDGTLGGYGGDWFGTREALLDVKRGLLTHEGTVLPARAFVG